MPDNAQCDGTLRGCLIARLPKIISRILYLKRLLFVYVQKHCSICFPGSYRLRHAVDFCNTLFIDFSNTGNVFFAGTLLNYIEIRGIASDPWSANVKQVERFNDISTVVQPVVDAMCDSQWFFILILTINKSITCDRYRT